MSEHQPNPTGAAGGLSDAIARSKRILELVDIYVERPDRMNRNALRSHLLDEFTEAAASARATVQAVAIYQCRENIRADKDAWSDCSKDAHDHMAKYPACFATRIVYAAPSPAAREAGDGVREQFREVGVWEPDGSKFKTYRKENLNGIAMYVREAGSR
jgi:hypothetical protein